MLDQIWTQLQTIQPKHIWVTDSAFATTNTKLPPTLLVGIQHEPSEMEHFVNKRWRLHSSDLENKSGHSALHRGVTDNGTKSVFHFHPRPAHTGDMPLFVLETCRVKQFNNLSLSRNNKKTPIVTLCGKSVVGRCAVLHMPPTACRVDDIIDTPREVLECKYLNLREDRQDLCNCVWVLKWRSRYQFNFMEDCSQRLHAESDSFPFLHIYDGSLEEVFSIYDAQCNTKWTLILVSPVFLKCRFIFVYLLLLHQQHMISNTLWGPCSLPARRTILSANRRLPTRNRVARSDWQVPVQLQPKTCPVQ